MSDSTEGNTPNKHANTADSTVVKHKPSHQKTPIDATLIRPKSKPVSTPSAVFADNTVYRSPASSSGPTDNADDMTRLSSHKATGASPAVSLNRDDSEATQIKTSGASQSANDATLIKGAGSVAHTVANGSASEEPAKTRPSPLTENMIKVDALNYPDDHEAALTHIRDVIIGQDNSQGFSKARRAADIALTNNKIILNRRFVLEAILGAGGMGTVYRARDLRKIEANDLNPYVAVKVLNEDFKHHPDAFVSLQREASRSHQLAHPNVVNVHDFDRDGDVIYMTMELLEGEGLDVLMREHRDKGLELEKALPIIADFCKGLIYAHKQHIIHSDLKPGNIFIDKAGAKVLDFGTARIASQARVQGDFDAGNLGALTPAYASLEMLNQDLDEETHQSDDVFAAGLITYELLSGKHPYDRKPADKALLDDLKPKRISQLSKRQWRTLEHALKLRRVDRLQTIDEFYDGFFHKKSLPFFMIASVLLLGVIGWFGYQRYIVPDELTQKINATYVKAKGCFDNKDYACTIDSAKAVVQMSPEHLEAKTLLVGAQTKLFDKKVAGFVDSAEQCLINKDMACANSYHNLLENLSPGSPETIAVNQRIIETRTEIQFLESLSVSENCLSDKNYSCTINAAKKALSLRPDSEQAASLLAQAEKSLASVKGLYKKHMAKAQSCFKSRDYNCAIDAASSALKYSTSSEAISIKQKAEFALVERQKKIASAKKMLAEAKSCFNAKRYSCAIAKSESSLEFLPGYRPAISLKRSAKAAIEALKKSIVIE